MAEGGKLARADYLKRVVEFGLRPYGFSEAKAENALEWVGRLNNIRACAMELVEKEIIYA